MKLSIKWLVISLLTLFVSCSEKKENKESKESESHSTQQSNQVADSSSEEMGDDLRNASPEEKKKASGATYIPGRLKPKPTDDEVKRSVKQFLVSMRKSENLAEFAFEEWDNYWIPKFNEPLEKPNDQISLVLKNYTDNLIPDLAIALSKSREDWMQDDEMRKSAIILMGLASAFSGEDGKNEQGKSSAGDLPKLIGKYQNRMPPTTGDLLLLRIAGVTKLLLESSPDLTENQFLEWRTFSEAKNPIYRMIALDLFGNFDTTLDQARDFYESYEQETEVGILKKLNHDLMTFDGEWVKALMKNTKAKLDSK